MIYRILHDENYLMHLVHPVESMRKLGEKHGVFAFNSEPKPYASVWTPLQIEFHASEGKKSKTMPDVSEHFGRLFLSERACQALKVRLETCGELLPVTYKNGTGYIFNPLVTAEQLGAIDDKLTTHDQHGNLAHFGFVEAKLKDTAIFKTRLDTWTGIFCSDMLKQAYENAGLTGITFHPDVSNPIGEPHGTLQ